MGDSDEEDDNDANIDQAEIIQGVKKEHILPVLEWLKE